MFIGNIKNDLEILVQMFSKLLGNLKEMFTAYLYWSVSHK